MRRTNKRKNNSKNRHITKKKRFGKKGGIQNQCLVCGQFFHLKGTIGAPTRSDDINLYENHIKTHLKCNYCDVRVLNKNELIKHLLKNHKDKYNIAKSIIFDEKNVLNSIDKINLIDKFISTNMAINEFFTRIENKEKSNIEKAKKAEQEEQKKLKLEQDRLQKEAKQTALAEKIKIKEEQERLKKQAELDAKEADKIRQAEIQRQREIEKAEQERIKREKEASKRAAKDVAIAERELVSMGEEDKNALANELEQATTVKEVEEIISNSKEQKEEQVSRPTLKASAQEFVPRNQNINLIELLNKYNLYRIVNNAGFQGDIYNIIKSKYYFPLIRYFTDNMTDNDPIKIEYTNMIGLLICLVGILNNLFQINNIDLKLIIKGGKSAQMILSSYNFKTSNIKSDDVDILLVQDRMYDNEFLKNIGKQFVSLVNRLFNSENISIKEPNINDRNPNIYKISYIIKTDPATGKHTYKAISDIDFKQQTTDFFTGTNIIELPVSIEYYSDIINLLYYLQTPQAFLAEKKYYLNIYENVQRKVYNNNNEIECDCNNLIEEGKKGYIYECDIECKDRKFILEKFQKYIDPFEKLLKIKSISASDI